MRARDLSNATVATVVGLATLMAGSLPSRADPPVRGDINGDGQINFDDINAFVACLTHGVCPNYWVREEPAVRPPGRYGTNMAYDICRKVTVLFGGWHGAMLNDTWEWDANNWTQRFPVTSPSIRYAHAMAYDSCRCVTVLFGGGGQSGEMYDDTWEWDGTTWQQVASTGPSPRWTTLAYDAANQEVVLFGGHVWDGAWHAAGETWVWNGLTWTDVTPDPNDPNQSPPARGGHGVAYDSEREKVVLFGGYSHDLQQYLSDTWEWDGQTWTDVTPSDPNQSPPPGIVDNRMVYDADRGRTVIFEIHVSDPPVFYPETWEWNGVVWQQAEAAGPVQWNNLGAMAYDAGRATTVLFGGYPTVDETWEYGPQ